MEKILKCLHFSPQKTIFRNKNFSISSLLELCTNMNKKKKKKYVKERKKRERKIVEIN
jgi:hypothetical protein